MNISSSSESSAEALHSIIGLSVHQHPLTVIPVLPTNF